VSLGSEIISPYYLTEAIRREKQIKKWNRAWKIDLIERSNPRWHDLWPTIVGGGDVDSRFRGNDGKVNAR
jgi:hypothetical protein